MEHNRITLELLVRSGNPGGVMQFAEKNGFDQSQKEDKMVEASIYSSVRFMEGDECGCGIESGRVCEFLDHPKIAEYFSKTNNTALLCSLIDALIGGTQVMMEAYAQITAIDVLSIKPLAEAIRNNLSDDKVSEKMGELVKRGYNLVFCPHDIDAEMVNHYFPIIDQWRDMIKPGEVAETSIKEFADKDDWLHYDYEKEFIYAAIDKLIALTDRETVSELMHTYFADHEDYQTFIADKRIDGYKPKPKSKKSKADADDGKVDPDVERAVKRFEHDYPTSVGVERDLAERIGGKGKDYIARKLGEWFSSGKVFHLKEVADYENGVLFDHDIARKSFGEALAEACAKGALDRLDYALKLPEYLIDASNPAIAGFVEAYKITQQTKREK